jgi:long-subunit acyl-CoA synthetase (AMP-forming)
MVSVLGDVVDVGEAFATQVERRGDAPAIVNSDLDVDYNWRQYGAAARRGDQTVRDPHRRMAADSGEVTPTMKLKRRAIEQKYAVQIDSLYTS